MLGRYAFLSQDIKDRDTEVISFSCQKLWTAKERESDRRLLHKYRQIILIILQLDHDERSSVEQPDINGRVEQVRRWVESEIDNEIGKSEIEASASSASQSRPKRLRQASRPKDIAAMPPALISITKAVRSHLYERTFHLMTCWLNL